MTSSIADTHQKIEDNYRLHLSWQYSIVEFLGLPSLKEIRPLTLEEIYVPLSLRWESVDKGERVYVPDAMEKSKHLVVLGDPGSGKSTLIKVLTYSFGRIEPTPFARRFPATRVPIPIILRDHNVRRWQTPYDMLSDFVSKLSGEMREGVTVEWLMSALTAGRGILMLDGLDEVGNIEDRKNLRDNVVRPLLAQMPESFAVLTSRVVGYEEVPFDEPKLGQLGLAAGERGDQFSLLSPPLSTQRCYVAPFTDEEIEQFVSRWYAAREHEEARRKAGWESLLQALRNNDRIRRLATNPSLLTIIALVHRVTAQLPSGRVKLYEKIAEAYLETIQNYRKLGQFPASLEQMKRWLARVAWEMQNQRSGQQEGELLASEGRVLGWLTEAISVDRDDADEEAAQFLDFIARRSGLLIQRGPGEFAFVHLTFQEYFAAWHLRGEVFDFNSLVNHCVRFVADRSWHETLVLLFELLAEFSRAGDNLAGRLVESARTESSSAAATAEFFSLLLLDDQSGVSIGKQREMCAFALERACNDYNQTIVENLRLLQPESPNLQPARNRFEMFLGSWLDMQLENAEPGELGKDFFFVGAQFDSSEYDWGAKVSDWIGRRGQSETATAHARQIVAYAGDRPDVCAWAVSRIEWIDWLRYGQSYKPLIEESIGGIFGARGGSPRHLLLAHLAGAYAASRSFFVRQSCLAVAKVDDQAFLELETNRTLANDLDKIWLEGYGVTGGEPAMQALALRYAKSQFSSGLRAVSAFLLIYQLKHLGSDTTEKLISATARGVASTLSPGTRHKHYPWLDEVEPDMAVEMLRADRTFLSPNTAREEFDVQVARLRELVTAGEDWTRLLGITGLLLLGKGTPELCAERNALLDKGRMRPRELTFPAEVREAADAEDFRTNFSELLWYIFLHEPEAPWLLPEWFEPENEASKFLSSTPKEFYELSARVLNPEGKTS